MADFLCAMASTHQLAQKFFQLAMADSLCAMAIIHLLPRNLSNLAMAIFLHAMAKLPLIQKQFLIFSSQCLISSQFIMLLMVILPCVWIFWLFCRDGTKNFSNRKTKENHCI
jgi:hypothetical protein